VSRLLNARRQRLGMFVPVGLEIDVGEPRVNIFDRL
jgi:hypothetical protein